MKVLKIVFLALFTAISIVLVSVPFLRFPIFPQVNFLIYDLADIPMLIATFAFGPLSGLAVVVAASFYQGIFIDSSSGIIGIFMHILASGGLVIVSGLIYRANKTRKGAYLALLFGSLTMVLTMVLWNLIFTPIFMNAPRAVVVNLLPYIAAFNIIKAGINSVVTALLYKTVNKGIKTVLDKHK